jgi:hypothetical protein
MVVSKTMLGLPLVVVLGVGCALQQKRVEREVTRGGVINCATAEGDLRVLYNERANVAERVVEGATAIYPAGAVVGLVTGTEVTKLKVAVGEYNGAIDERIAEIQQTCGIQKPQ